MQFTRHNQILAMEFLKMVQLMEDASIEAAQNTLSEQNLRKIRELSAFTLDNIFQTLIEGICVMKDPQMLRIWENPTKRNN